MHVLRWSHTAYETIEQLEAERLAIEALGGHWRLEAERSVPPEDLGACDVLLVTSKVHVDAGVLARLADRSRLVLTTTSGVDHIDLDAASRLGVSVARCAFARRDAVVEHTIAGLIWGMRQFGVLEQAAAQGRWARHDLPSIAPRGLSGSRIAVVGAGGVIGSQVLAKLEAFGARCEAIDPRFVGDGPRTSLDDVLEEVDGITLHCQLHRQSVLILDEARLSRLPAHAVVVNTARGGLLDVEAALRRVASGQLRALVSDVFPEEPYPRIAQSAKFDNVLFTPHSAGYTTALAGLVTAEVRTAVEAWQAGGEVPYLVVDARMNSR